MDARTTIQNFMTLLESKNLDLQDLREAFAEDASWWLLGKLPVSGIYKGRDTIINDWNIPVFNMLKPETVTLKFRNLVVEGERGYAEANSRSESKSGFIYENEYVFVFTAREGKITSVREYCDTEASRELLNIEYKGARIYQEQRSPRDE